MKETCEGRRQVLRRPPAALASTRVRLAVYCDYPYRRRGRELSAEQPFSLFLAGLAPRLDALVLVGRLDPAPDPFPYVMPATVGFQALPHYDSLAHPTHALRGLVGALRRFWQILSEVDVVWLLGPHPLSLAFAALAALRGRRVILGVRQDLPEYVRHRHPDARALALLARLLEGAYLLAARRCSVVVVGAELARHYAAAGQLLLIWVSLVRGEDLLGPAELAHRDYSGELTVLSVGRLDSEKNPLLLADVLLRLRERDPRWRLVVCGDGPLRGALERRLDDLGIRAWADLRGHVAAGEALRAVYRASHFFLHISWTEGMPQVLLEALAARLPMVATAVGGVPEMAREAALLIEPDDANAAAAGLLRLAADADLRERLVSTGAQRASEHTLQAECGRVADFLGAPGRP